MKFTKSRDDKILTGVCGGLAGDLKMPVYVLRLIFLIGFFITQGATLLIYIALAILMKKERNFEKEIVIEPEDNANAKEKESKKSARTLTRKRRERVIAGVCSGLSEYFKLDLVIIRLIFVLLTIFNGVGILIYIILWVILPSEDR